MAAVVRSQRRTKLIVAVAALATLGGLLVAPGVVAATEVHLTAMGDIGNGPNSDAVLRAVGAAQPDAHFALGDLSYNDNPESEWCRFVKDRVGETLPFELLSGNHESDGFDGHINNFSACLTNQLPGLTGYYGRDYWVDIPQNSPQVRYIGISAGLTMPEGVRSFAPGSPELAFLVQAIDDARADNVPWVVVGAHYPCLSVGVYSCVLPQNVLQLLIAKRVDLVLHGHEHAYMRTHQLRNSVAGCQDVAIGSVDTDCVADSDSSMIAGRGTVVATVGTGGVQQRDVFPTDAEAGYFAAFAGANLNQTFGYLDMRFTDATLTASFVRAAGANFSDQFTITKGAGGNEPPTALFTSSTNGLAVTVDGSTSSDLDGTITGWAWAFGDGSTDTGVRPQAHTYAAAGTYQVTLTVTDDQGATANRSANVTVTEPPQGAVLVDDNFSRTVAGGWGSSTPLGGAWSTTPASAVSVNGSAGVMRLGAGGGAWATKPQVVETSIESLGTLALDKVTTGGGLYASILARNVPNQGSYRAKLRLRSDSVVTLALVRTAASGTETTIRAEQAVPGLTYGPGTPINVRVRVTGTSPTTVSAKVWRADTTEPTAWLATATDTTAGLQAGGGVGWYTYLSSSATNAPVTVTVDNVRVARP